MHWSLLLLAVPGTFALHQWWSAHLAKRAAPAAKAVHEARVAEPFDPYKKPRLFDSAIDMDDWRNLSPRNKARFRQALNLNVLAMLEHERLGEYRYRAMRLDRAAGLGGPTWRNSSPYSSRRTPR